MTKIQNPKQKNNRFAKRPAGTGLKFVFLNLRPARSCLAMAGGFIWNLPARRFFGGVLGIWDFRHKTPKQSHFISNLDQRIRNILWFQIGNHFLYDGHDISPSFPGDSMGIFNDPGRMSFKFSPARHGQIFFLVLPG